MRRLSVKGLSAMTALGLVVFPGAAVAQQKTLKEQLIGTWLLVSIETMAKDGTKVSLFGANPKGIIMFDAGGRYTQVQVRADRPRFKSSNRLEGTPEENKAVLAGGVGQFGTWSVNEADKTITYHQEAVVHNPNEEGTDSTRVIILNGDELKIRNPLTGDGGSAEQVLRRAK